MKTRMVTRFFHWRTEQTGVTQIWWVVKQKTASFQTYPFLSITHFSSITHFTKFHLSIFSVGAFSCPFSFLGSRKTLTPFVFLHTLCLPYCSTIKKDIDPFSPLLFLLKTFCFQSQRNILTSKVTGTHHFSLRILVSCWYESLGLLCFCVFFLGLDWFIVFVMDWSRWCYECDCFELLLVVVVLFLWSFVCDSSRNLLSFVFFVMVWFLFVLLLLVDCWLLSCNVFVFVFDLNSMLFFVGLILSTFKICGDVWFWRRLSFWPMASKSVHSSGASKPQI